MKIQLLSSLVTIATVIHAVSGDIYLHNPRGSNNRLNENTAQRRNANRMFDSQNNNRGGYNVGDTTDKASGEDEGKQYRMKYFQSGPDMGKSFLTVEWTNQHGCGGNEDTDPQKQNCGLVLQYMCQDDVDTATGTSDTLRNGVNTNKQDYNRPTNENPNPKDNNVQQNRGLHESWDWYNKCVHRQRNEGLFTADQKLNKIKGMEYVSATRTRQNANGNRYGYECPEERDYFPYWHPTPWKDVAVLAENSSLCSHYTTKSFNVQPYGECIEDKGYSKYNNEAECSANGGQWMLFYNYLEKDTTRETKADCESGSTASHTYMWAVPYDTITYEPECLVMLDQPDCQEAPWSRSNHLGNGRDGLPTTYTWTLPHFPSGNTKRCVFRFRYNISTDDYDPYNTDFKYNKNSELGTPIENNPYVYVMESQNPLRLAINTAQFGRVFQDRTHVFKLVPRPAGLEQARIFNLNVRGKRGNIVQTYPAVEYDFVPTTLEVTKDDLVHIQWTGSNTHNNGGNPGDGQSGSAGEGRRGTDRHNFVELLDRSGNFPTPFESTNLWNNVEVAWIYHGKTDITPKDLAINLASSGYYRCADALTCPENEHAKYLVSTKEKMNNRLDNAPASYEGVMLRFTKAGTYHYMSTRNNSFTNRSQKAAVVVTGAKK